MYNAMASVSSNRSDAPPFPWSTLFACSWVGLIFCNEAEYTTGFLDNEVPLELLFVHCWMLHSELDHVFDVNWQSPGVVGVVQNKEPCTKLVTHLDIEKEDTFSQRAHKAAHRLLKLNH